MCRGVVCADQLGASTGTGLTVRLERAWCPPRALSGLARDFRPWQAVAAVGVEVHLWRVEVQLRRPLLVRAQPRPTSPRVAPHRLCPAACCRRLPRCRLLHPLLMLPAFDSLQHYAARATATIATIEDGLAGGSPAGCGAFLDVSELLSLLPLLLPVAARRLGAARRRQRRLFRRSSAAARTGRLRRASRASLAALAAPCRSLMAASSRPGHHGKKCGCFGAFFALWRALWLRARADLYCSRRALSNGTGVCRGPAQPWIRKIPPNRR